jgi:hypothetical protein
MVDPDLCDCLFQYLYFIVLIPSYRDIIVEILIILRGEVVCGLHIVK